jgi:hypothetical protein
MLSNGIFTLWHRYNINRFPNCACTNLQNFEGFVGSKAFAEQNSSFGGESVITETDAQEQYR